MAGRKKEEKGNGQYISQEQLCEQLDQQKTFDKELRQQQENNFKVCVRTLMDNTCTRMDAILKEVQELRISLQFTQKEVDDLKAASTSLSSNCKSNEMDIHKLAESMIAIDNKADILEGQSRSHNVMIDGIPESENERRSDSEEKVPTLFKEKLDLDPHTIGIDRAQRVGKASTAADGTHVRQRPRPVMVRLLRIKDRDTILSKAKMLRGSNIFINEDYPNSVRQKRKELLPKMKAARESGDTAFLRYDKLIIHKRH